MKSLQIKIFLLTMVFFSNAALAAKPVPSTCDDPDNALFVNLSDDEIWKSSMALSYATKNLEFGPVTVFLNVTGTRIAVKEKKLPHDFYALNRMTNLESLEKFLRAGGRVLVCPNCLERAGFKPQNVIKHKNIEMGGATLVREELACTNKQMSW